MNLDNPEHIEIIKQTASDIDTAYENKKNTKHKNKNNTNTVTSNTVTPVRNYNFTLEDIETTRRSRKTRRSQIGKLLPRTSPTCNTN